MIVLKLPLNGILRKAKLIDKSSRKYVNIGLGLTGDVKRFDLASNDSAVFFFE